MCMCVFVCDFCVHCAKLWKTCLLGNAAVMAEDQKGRKMGQRLKIQCACAQSVFVHWSARFSCKCVCKCVGVWLREVKMKDEEKCFQQDWGVERKSKRVHLQIGFRESELKWERADRPWASHQQRKTWSCCCTSAPWGFRLRMRRRLEVPIQSCENKIL